MATRVPICTALILGVGTEAEGRREKWLTACKKTRISTAANAPAATQGAKTLRALL
jgi:hypothetical protein